VSAANDLEENRCPAPGQENDICVKLRAVSARNFTLYFSPLTGGAILGCLRRGLWQGILRPGNALRGIGARTAARARGGRAGLSTGQGGDFHREARICPQENGGLSTDSRRVLHRRAGKLRAGRRPGWRPGQFLKDLKKWNLAGQDFLNYPQPDSGYPQF